MSAPVDPLTRIAAALERITPAMPEAADPLAHPAYVWLGERLVAVEQFAPLPLDLLGGIDAQKAALLANARRLAAGHAAHDALLWGARGMGKSALVKSVAGAVESEGGDLALIEFAGDLDALPGLFSRIAAVARAWIVFVDDLSVDDPGAARRLRSLLEGGAEARPANARLHVTANRRHIVLRAHADEDAINPRDAADDRLALADRFGLSLGFHNCDQDGYLAMVAGYAEHFGLEWSRDDALLWANQRGARSGRVAWHYAVELAGRAGVSIGASSR